MERRIVGVVFCFISALLILGRYIVAAIYGSNTATIGKDEFQLLLNYVGPTLLILSVISLFLGLIYLISAELKK